MSGTPSEERAKTEARLESCARILEWLMGFVILVVALGLIGEEKSLDPLSRWNIVSRIMVAGGVCGEFILHVLLSKTNKRLVASQKLGLEELKADAAAANRKTEELRSANGELEKAVENEKQKTLAIFNRMEWRKLDNVAIQTMSLPLSRLRSPLGIVVVALLANEYEVLRYSRQLAQLLHDNRIRVEWELRPELPAIVGIQPIGVILLTHPDDMKAHRNFTVELHHALLVGGVEVVFEETNKIQQGQVVLGVGINPKLTRELDLRELGWKA